MEAHMSQGFMLLPTFEQTLLDQSFKIPKTCWSVALPCLGRSDRKKYKWTMFDSSTTLKYIEMLLMSQLSFLRSRNHRAVALHGQNSWFAILSQGAVGSRQSVLAAIAHESSVSRRDRIPWLMCCTALYCTCALPHSLLLWGPVAFFTCPYSILGPSFSSVMSALCFAHFCTLT